MMQEPEEFQELLMPFSVLQKSDFISWHFSLFPSQGTAASPSAGILPKTKATINTELSITHRLEPDRVIREDIIKSSPNKSDK